MQIKKKKKQFEQKKKSTKIFILLDAIINYKVPLLIKKFISKKIILFPIKKNIRLCIIISFQDLRVDMTLIYSFSLSKKDSGLIIYKSLFVREIGHEIVHNGDSLKAKQNFFYYNINIYIERILLYYSERAWKGEWTHSLFPIDIFLTCLLSFNI